MIITVIRTVILYLLVVVSVRIMGKRQVGELQPLELVVTILLSEIAAIPMQNNDIPLLNSILAVLILTSLELIISLVGLKSMKFRSICEGNPQIVVKNGRPDNKQLKKLRLTLDDILSALRQKNVFSIDKVKYAIVETNGALSVMLNAENNPATPKDMKLNVPSGNLACPVILDKKLSSIFYSECNTDEEKLKKLLKDKNLEINNIYLLTLDSEGKMTLIERDNEK